MTPPYKTAKIKEIADIVTVGDLGVICQSPVLYRGQPDDLPLLPKIARDTSTIKTELIREEWLLTEFSRQGMGMETMPVEICDRLALAQHHGLPTRLLDWTQNPIAALWFAVEATKPGEKPVVWRFETNAEDFASVPKQIEPPRTIVFRPNHITARIRVQSGWFTWHQIKEDATYAFENQRRYRPRLTKITVAGDAERLRWQLNDMGINRASLFPDLGNLCKHLEWESINVAKVIDVAKALNAKYAKKPKPKPAPQPSL